MFTKKNVKKVRSLFSGFALTGLAATALFLGANSTINAQTESEATNAPSGGTTNKFLNFTNGNVTNSPRTDFVTVAFNTGGPINWKVLSNPANPLPNQALIRRFNFGLTGNTADDADSIVVGDYNGDGKTELAVFRNTVAAAPGVFYVAQFPVTTGGVLSSQTTQQTWGRGDIDSVVPGDYDGDGKVDYTVVRAVGTAAVNNLVWFIINSSNNTTRSVYFGNIPATGSGLTGTALFNGADFNGDGRDEFVLLNRNTAGTVVNYYIGDSITGALLTSSLFPTSTQAFSFGNYNTDYSITPADYTGDGKADFVACRQTDPSGSSIWYIRNSATGVTTGTRFGIPDPAFAGDGDIPVRGDYDGDNIHDIAVWRPSNQTFYYISSRFSNSIQSQRFGDFDDTPLGAFGQY